MLVLNILRTSTSCAIDRKKKKDRRVFARPKKFPRVNFEIKLKIYTLGPPGSGTPIIHFYHTNQHFSISDPVNSTYATLSSSSAVFLS